MCVCVYKKGNTVYIGFGMVCRFRHLVEVSECSFPRIEGNTFLTQHGCITFHWCRVAGLKHNETHHWCWHAGVGSTRKLISPGRKCAEGANGHCVLSFFPAPMLEGTRQWAVNVQAIVGHHESEGGGHPKVSYEANEEGRHDAHRNGLLGVLDFFP